MLMHDIKGYIWYDLFIISSHDSKKYFCQNDVIERTFIKPLTSPGSTVNVPFYLIESFMAAKKIFDEVSCENVRDFFVGTFGCYFW